MLPQPVPEDEEIKIRLKWTSKWKFANFSVSTGIAPDGSDVFRSLGPTTGPQPILPDILPAPGGSLWSFKTTLGAPTPWIRSLSTVSSGDTSESWIDDGNGWQWSVANGEQAKNPAIALGRWSNYDEPPTQGMPGVKVNLFPAMAKDVALFPPEVRRVVTFLERFLPDFPLTEIEVYQGPSVLPLSARISGLRQASTHGLVGIRTVSSTSVTSGSSVRREQPYLAQTMIARQIAGQYWGQNLTAASDRDSWVLDALSDAYAFLYIRSAFGFDAYADIMSIVRESLEKPTEISSSASSSSNWNDRSARQRAHSLTASPSMTDIPSRIRSNYGVYVVAEMLRNRLGDPVFFSAIDRFAQERQGKRITTEQFQTILEEAAQEDLSDFFDYWVRGGLLPAIEATVSVTDDGLLQGCIVTDVPYGTFDVPVRVTDGDEPRIVEALVEVVNGEAYFEIPDRKQNAEVEIDPYGMVLAISRDVRTRGELPCVPPVAEVANP